MISRIRGTLLHRDLTACEIMTGGGVAYVVEIPLSVFERLPKEGVDIELRTHQLFREDAQVLYGFLEETERNVFARLLTASGVGPKLALAMLSRLSPDRLVRAITDRDIATLRQIPGLGTNPAYSLTVTDKSDPVSGVVYRFSFGLEPLEAGIETVLGIEHILVLQPGILEEVIIFPFPERGAVLRVVPDLCEPGLDLLPKRNLFQIPEGDFVFGLNPVRDACGGVVLHPAIRIRDDRSKVGVGVINFRRFGIVKRLSRENRDGSE